ncbi:MAG: type I secretion protein TolC, partial [Nitrosomonadales bacterium]|nr:type I secretion protein TolC [Nitrosomonadales bacterium]
AGTRTNIEVLNAQQKLYASRLELSRVQYILVNDIINLKQAAGMLNEAQLHSLNQFFAIN